MHLNETGRTLIETLGKLAIMGILSVTGIWAYHSALDKHKANTLIAEAQRRAIVVAGQIGFGGQKQPSLAEFSPYNTTSAGTFGDVITAGLHKQFGIQVSGVKKSVCQNILNTIGDTTPIRRLSLESAPTTPLTTCEPENAFLFIYNEDMTAENDTQYCSTHADCDECGTCNQTTHVCVGACESACNENDSCGENECVICDTETKTCQNKCVEVEYLESTGTQYIDTGIYASYDLRLQANVYFVALAAGVTTHFFGGRNITSAGAGYGMATLYNVLRSDYFGSHVQVLSSCPTNSWIFIDKNKNVTTVNETSFSNEPSTMVDMTRTVYLFGLNAPAYSGSYSGTVRYSYARIYKDDTLVRNFIPVLSPESSQYAGAPCMFDRVTKKLFCNKGTGEDFKTNLDE